MNGIFHSQRGKQRPRPPSRPAHTLPPQPTTIQLESCKELRGSAAPHGATGQGAAVQAVARTQGLSLWLPESDEGGPRWHADMSHREPEARLKGAPLFPQACDGFVLSTIPKREPGTPRALPCPAMHGEQCPARSLPHRSHSDWDCSAGQHTVYSWGCQQSCRPGT